MELIMSDLQYEILLIYLEDLIVYAQTFEDHQYRLKLTLQNLKEAKKKA
jgi:hypothetical protein